MKANIDNITTLKNYPDDGNHVQYITDLPCRIEKGRDEFGSKNRWYIIWNNVELVNSLIDKSFIDLDKALEYAYTEYVKVLKNELIKCLQ